MLTYKRFVAFSLSLTCVLAVGAVNALFMTPASEWYVNLVKPAINPDIHSLLWLVVYLLTALAVAEFFIEKKLRRSIWSVIILFFANPLWCLVFFRLHSEICALIIIAITVADLIYMTVASAKKTTLHWILCLAITCWYIYLAVLNITIAVMNF